MDVIKWNNSTVAVLRAKRNTGGNTKKSREHTGKIHGDSLSIFYWRKHHTDDDINSKIYAEKIKTPKSSNFQ